MGLGEIFKFIRNAIVAIIIFSSLWVLLYWGYNLTVLDDPPTLKVTAQNFIDLEPFPCTRRRLLSAFEQC